MKVLVTGAAGFIGFHLASRLLESGHEVSGLDSLNDYYDVGLKHARLEKLQRFPGFVFNRVSLEDYNGLRSVFDASAPDVVVNLAAQAGVRYSLENPHAYLDANLHGFLNLIEMARHFDIKHLVFASSSSVYGGNVKQPFCELDSVDHPISLYAVTKKSNELMAHCYSHLYGIPMTGLRFFTVYGPYGRPDMALFLFTKAILDGDPIKVFNGGKMLRDFTYVDDIVNGIIGVIGRPPEPHGDCDRASLTPDRSWAPYRIFNIGNNNPVPLERFIDILEEKLGKKAVREYLPLQPGDVPATYADIDALTEWCGFRPQTDLETGIGRFVEWYRSYYNV